MANVYPLNSDLQRLLNQYGALRKDFPNVIGEDWDAALSELAEYIYKHRERVWIVEAQWVKRGKVGEGPPEVVRGGADGSGRDGGKNEGSR